MACRYGIPNDIITQTDRSTLWDIICATEALNMSVITDPYDLYKDRRRNEKDVQNDILQETYVFQVFDALLSGVLISFPRSINTSARWINLLLMSSSEPVTIPMGARYSAVSSLLLVHH